MAVLIGSIITANQLQGRIKNEESALQGWKLDVIPKLDKINSAETEEETFSRHNSTLCDCSEDNQSESTDIEEEECDFILISSRNENQFTLRLNQQIQRLSENKIFKQLKIL